METYHFLEKALRSLSADEHKRFEKFLHSPYFRKNSTSKCNVCKLYDLYKARAFPQKFDWDTTIKTIFCQSHFITLVKTKLYKKFKSEIKSELLFYILDFIKCAYPISSQNLNNA